MRTPGISKLLALSALVCALGAMPQKSDAAVILSGCSGGVFGNDCGLSELLGGGSFMIDNKQFTNWDLVSFGGRLLDATLIRVYPLDGPSNPGFMLTDTGNTLRAADGDATQNELTFNVFMVGGSLRTKDNTLEVQFGEVVAVPGTATVADVSETLFSNFNLLGDKDVFCDSTACTNGTGSDSADFAPQISLLVFANISAVSGAGDVAEIESITLRFSQIPEPGSIALLALGIAGMGWSLRRRRVR